MYVVFPLVEESDRVWAFLGNRHNAQTLWLVAIRSLKWCKKSLAVEFLENFHKFRKKKN
ncbi:MAG: hypothetical protein AAGE96_13080 [Cyanobacteria bacterium P01_G01_bin.19]